MLDIDKLRCEWEKPFLEIIDGLEISATPIYGTIWFKGTRDNWYFQQEKNWYFIKNGDYIDCNYKNVWKIMSYNNLFDVLTTQDVISKLIHKHLEPFKLIPVVIKDNEKLMNILKKKYWFKNIKIKINSFLKEKICLFKLFVISFFRKIKMISSQ